MSSNRKREDGMSERFRRNGLTEGCRYRPIELFNLRHSRLPIYALPGILQKPKVVRVDDSLRRRPHQPGDSARIFEFWTSQFDARLIDFVRFAEQTGEPNSIIDALGINIISQWDWDLASSSTTLSTSQISLSSDPVVGLWSLPTPIRSRSKVNFH